MAAYDLRVQKPSSLAIPDSPGANDLARFLSVSESSRANREKEELNQNMFDWEKGAGQRKLTAEEGERERVRRQNMEFGNALTGSTEGYMANAKENYRLSDSAVSKFRETYPDATEDQVENVRRSTRDRITQDPNAYIKSVEMARSVESDLISNYGYSPEQARKSAQERVGSYFSTPKEPNEEILKAQIEAIQNGGLLDHMSDYDTSRSDGSSGSSSSSSRGRKSFMESEKFLKQYQLDNENNEYRPGTRGTFNWNFPFTKDEIYKDDLEEMGTLMQSREGINPMYLNSVIQGLAKEGQLPKGVSASDMKNPDGSFYKTVKENASLLQRQTESNNGSGGNGRGAGDVSLSELHKLAQGDLGMKNQALNQLGDMYQRAGGGTLTSEEQYAIMSDPGLLEEFGVAIKQSLQQQGGGNNAPAPAASPVPTTAPVVENSGAEAGRGSSVAAEEGDDPELTSLLEGTDQPGQPTGEGSMTLEQDLERVMNMSDRDMRSDDLFGPGLDRAKRLKAKVRSGEATVEEQQSLVSLLPVPAPKAEKSSGIPDNVENLTLTDIRNEIPPSADRRKAYELLSTIQSGRGSDQQIEELMAMLTATSQ